MPSTQPATYALEVNIDPRHPSPAGHSPAGHSPAGVRVQLTGEFDVTNASTIYRLLHHMLSAPHTAALTIDLTGVAVLACAGINTLIAVHHAGRRLGREVRITNPQPFVREALEITGSLGLLEVSGEAAPTAATPPRDDVHRGAA